MGDCDTDPKMMREQQDKDAPETIAPDETRDAPGASDTDAASRAARLAAQAGRTQDGGGRTEAVFAANRASVEPGASVAGTVRTPADRAAAQEASLAQKGRSRLGS